MSQVYDQILAKEIREKQLECSSFIHGLGDTLTQTVKEILDSIGEQAPGFTCDTLLIRCVRCGAIVGARPAIQHAVYTYSRQRIKQLLEPLNVSDVLRRGYV